MDGRVYVWKISETSEEEDKPQISAKTVVALQITGEGESVHPRVCWHCHKQVINYFYRSIMGRACLLIEM